MCDREFLTAMGVEPYDPEVFEEEDFQQRGRTRIFQVIAILQFLAILTGLVWTWK
jgi:hypothetical protein